MTATSYMRGVVQDDPERQIHAARLEGTDEYVALCGAGRVVPLPGNFDPDAPNACQRCGGVAGLTQS